MAGVGPGMGIHLFILPYEPWQPLSEIYRVAVTADRLSLFVRSVRRAIFPVPLPGGALLFAGNPESLEPGPLGEAAPTTAPLQLTTA